MSTSVFARRVGRSSRELRTGRDGQFAGRARRRSSSQPGLEDRTLLDDPSVAGVRGSYPFDDEGMLAAPTTIIENGVFVRPLTDLMSATFLGTTRTPNGRAQAWDRKVYARMSNTFFARGASEPAELFASLRRIYLEGCRNGIEDPQGWGIQSREHRPRYRTKSRTDLRARHRHGLGPEILSNIT